jgi:hypothetical protein
MGSGWRVFLFARRRVVVAARSCVEDQVELLFFSQGQFPGTADRFAKSLLPRAHNVGPGSQSQKGEGAVLRCLRLDGSRSAFLFKKDGSPCHGAARRIADCTRNNDRGTRLRRRSLRKCPPALRHQEESNYSGTQRSRAGHREVAHCRHFTHKRAPCKESLGSLPPRPVASAARGNC